MVKLNATQQSTKNVMINQNRLRRAENGLWRLAKNHSMFRKTSENGKSKYTRLIKPLAYKIAVSGASCAESTITDMKLKNLGVQAEVDSKMCPWSCSMAPNAALPLEMFLASVVQQILYNNKLIRKGIGKHGRNNRELTKISIDEVKKAIFDPASGVPTSTTVLPFILSRKKIKGEKEAPGDREAPDVSAIEKEDDDEEEHEDEENDDEENEDEEEE